MTNTIIPVGGNVQGNITDCKIENVKIATQLKSIFSLTQVDTYRSYDVCTKQTVKEYSVPNYTPFAGNLAFGSLFLAIVLVFAIFMHNI